MVEEKLKIMRVLDEGKKERAKERSLVGSGRGGKAKTHPITKRLKIENRTPVRLPRC